jgi:hypothetical protein
MAGRCCSQSSVGIRVRSANGPDAGDVAALEEVTDKVVGLLGDDGVIPGDFADKLKQAGVTGKITNGE